MNTTLTQDQTQKLDHYSKNPSDLQIHSAASLQPPMLAEEYASLREDMRLNGQYDPCECVWDSDSQDWSLLEGRHRLTVCIELALHVKLKEVQTTDPVGYVLSKHNRRNLSAGQKAVMAHRMVTTTVGRQSQIGTRAHLDQAQAAAKVGVGVRSIKKIARIEKELGSDAVDRIWSGEQVLAEVYRQLPKVSRASVPDFAANPNPVSASSSGPLSSALQQAAAGLPPTPSSPTFSPSPTNSNPNPLPTPNIFPSKDEDEDKDKNENKHENENENSKEPQTEPVFEATQPCSPAIYANVEMPSTTRPIFGPPEISDTETVRQFITAIQDVIKNANKYIESCNSLETNPSHENFEDIKKQLDTLSDNITKKINNNNNNTPTAEHLDKIASKG
jgi:hypothetical protein